MMPRFVFACGCDRSGTTLLGRELSNIIENSFLVPECYFFHDIMSIGAIENMETLRVILKSSERYQVWKQIETLPNIANFSKRNILLSLIYHNFPEAKHAFYIIDTTPVSYSWRVLDESLSDDLYLHIIRDARSVAKSLLGVNWGPVHSGKAIEYWSDRVSMARALVESEINYAEMVSSDSGNLPKGLKRFLCRNKIKYSELHYGRKQAIETLPEFTRQQHKLLSQPFDKTKVEVEMDPYISYFYERNLVVRIQNGDTEIDFVKRRYKRVEAIEYIRAMIRYVKVLMVNYGKR